MGTDLPIAAVILAAGRSTRLGRPKQLLPLGDRPLLAHVVSCVAKSSVELRNIVLGHAAEQIQEEVDLDGFEIIRNPSFADGQGTSVRSAVSALDGRVSAIIFVLGDQPLQSFDIIDMLVESYQESPAPVIQPRFSEGPGNPVLIDRSMFDELRTLSGDTGARPILQSQRDRIRFIDVSDRPRPSDVDTWEDYERLQKQYEEYDVARGS